MEATQDAKRMHMKVHPFFISNRSYAVWGRKVPGTCERVHQCSRQTSETVIFASQGTGRSAVHLNPLSNGDGPNPPVNLQV